LPLRPSITGVFNCASMRLAEFQSVVPLANRATPLESRPGVWSAFRKLRLQMQGAFVQSRLDSSLPIASRHSVSNSFFADSK